MGAMVGEKNGACSRGTSWSADYDQINPASPLKAAPPAFFVRYCTKDMREVQGDL